MNWSRFLAILIKEFRQISKLQPTDTPYEVRVQRRYNPEGLSRYNIVPGLLGVILTMTMIMMTALAMTRPDSCFRFVACRGGRKRSAKCCR